MRQIKKGSTNRSVDLYIIDSTDGTPETGVVWNTAGIDLKYRREGSAVVSVTEATLAALTTAHTDGGFLAIGNGSYRFDLPDSAWATGADKVTIFGTVTGMIVMPVEVQLVDFDPEDTVRLGLTSLPNAAADAAGGLPISDAGGLDMDTILGRITGNVALASNLATAQSDLDTITGVDGVTLATIQGAITWNSQTISVSGATANLIFAGSGTGDVFSFTRSGSGNLMDANYSADFQAEVNTAADLSLSDFFTSSAQLVDDIVADMEADGGDLSSIMEALVNRLDVTETSGDAEMFNDAGVSQGTVTAAFTSVAGITSRKRMVI